MGYKASYAGDIILKDSENLDKVLEFMQKQYCIEEYSLSKSIDGEPLIEISSAGRDNYHEDEFIALYGLIGKYVKEASIEFVGEDETHWKHTFEDGEWKEYSGKVVYENPSKIAEVCKSDDYLDEEEDKGM